MNVLIVSNSSVSSVEKAEWIRRIVIGATKIIVHNGEEVFFSLNQKTISGIDRVKDCYVAWVNGPKAFFITALFFLKGHILPLNAWTTHLDLVEIIIIIDFLKKIF